MAITAVRRDIMLVAVFFFDPFTSYCETLGCIAPDCGPSLPPPFGTVMTTVRLVGSWYLLAMRGTWSMVTAATLSSRVLMRLGSP